MRTRPCRARLLLLAVVLAWDTARIPPEGRVATDRRPAVAGQALHLISHTTDDSLEKLAGQLPELAKLGINCLILEVDYGFEFQSHPELRQGDRQITRAVQPLRGRLPAKRHRACPAVSMPWSPVLAEETQCRFCEVFGARPDARVVPENKGIYCREWDPMNPKTNEIVFR